MGSLFHYTRAETFIEKILPSKCLKTNSLALMNDPREAEPWAFGGVNLPLEQLFPEYYSRETHMDCQYKLGKIIKNKFQVFCFSGAKNEGWNNEMMWAHYGENQRGICLEFDEFELLKTIDSTFSNIKYRIDNISYNQEQRKPYLSWDKNKSKDDNFNNIMEICTPMLLTKSHFWEKEDERRISFLNAENPIEIPIYPALKAIYLGINFLPNYLSKIDQHIASSKTPLFSLIYQNYGYQKFKRLDQVFSSLSY